MRLKTEIHHWSWLTAIGLFQPTPEPINNLFYPKNWYYSVGLNAPVTRTSMFIDYDSLHESFLPKDICQN